MAFSMPDGVSQILGVGFPSHGVDATPLVTTAPRRFRSKNSENSAPEPKVPEAVMTGFFSLTPHRSTLILCVMLTPVLLVEAVFICLQMLSGMTGTPELQRMIRGDRYTGPSENDLGRQEHRAFRTDPLIPHPGVFIDLRRTADTAQAGTDPACHLLFHRQPAFCFPR